MKIKNQTALIGCIFGFALATVLIFFVNYNKDINTIQEIQLKNIECREYIDSLQSILDKQIIEKEYYNNIDTVVMNYDWGKEEIYIYEYN